MEFIADDILKEILHMLQFLDVVSYCKTDKKANSLRKCNAFWKDYLLNKYNNWYTLDSIILYGNGATKNKKLCNIIPKYWALSKYLDESKLIRSIQTSANGKPYKISKLVISGYDRIDDFVSLSSSLYGDDILIWKSSSGIHLRSVSDGISETELKLSLNTMIINKDTLLRDVKIKNLSLLFYIDTYMY
jgi:hypothetical protein